MWLQTKANIVYDSKTCQPQFVLCTNYIISYVLPTFVYNLTFFLKLCIHNQHCLKSTFSSIFNVFLLNESSLDIRS